MNALTEQPGVLCDLGAAAPAHQHHLDAGSQAGLDRPHAEQRDLPLTVVHQRCAASEQRTVEIDVQRSAHRALTIGGRSSNGASNDASSSSSGAGSSSISRPSRSMRDARTLSTA
jgi:hypothetical protein